MQCRHLFMTTICFVAIILVSCQNKPAADRPSGLKNMAPPPANELVQEGLDVESNDTFMQAVDISMAGDLSQWVGTLGFDDVDVWRIKAKAGTVADITIIPENDFDVIADYSLTANDADRRYFDFSLSGKPELLPNMRLTPQGGYLTIRGRNTEAQGPVKYRVLVSRVQATNGTPESEPDDSIESAQAILPDEQLDGTLFPAGDVDYYRTVLQKPSQVVYNLPDGAIEVAVESHDRVIWSAVSRKAQEIKSDIIQGDGQILYIRLKSLESPEDVLHYTFKVAPLETVPDEIEPNNSIDQAQKLNPDNVSSLTFHLDNESDVDVFELQTQQGQSYFLRLTGVESTFARVQASSDGTTVMQPPADNLTLCGVSSDGKLYLTVSPLIKAAAYPLEYHLVAEAEPEHAVEIEPNQTLAQAMELAFDVHIKGHIFPAGDVDIYRITVPSVAGATGVAGVLNVELDPGYAPQLLMKLQDAEGFEISQMNNSQTGKMSFDAPAGVYYLEVSGAGDKCVKPYTFHVGFVPSIGQVIQPPADDTPILPPANQAPDTTGDAALDDLLNTARKTDTVPDNTPPALPEDGDEDAF